MNSTRSCRWYDTVAERDWFGASNGQEARQWIDRCEKLLEGFEEKVFQVQSSLDSTQAAGYSGQHTRMGRVTTSSGGSAGSKPR